MSDNDTTNDEIMVNDQGTSDSSTDINTDQDLNVETDEDIQDSDANEEQEEGEEDQESDKIPFHKHPRWQEMRNKLKSLQEEKQRLEEQLSSNKEDKEEPPEPKTEQKNYSELDKILPERKFRDPSKNNYSSYEEMYRDMRNAIFEDLAILNKTAHSQEEAARAARMQEFDNSLEDIRLDLGDEGQFSEFKEFASQLYAQKEFESNPPDLKMVYAAYLKDFYNKDWNAKKKPKLNKIGGSNTAPAGNSQLTYSDISSMDMREIAERALQP